MHRAVGFFASLLCVAFLQAGAPAEWKPFRSADGLFQVQLPGTPVEKEFLLMGKKMKSYAVVVGLEGSFAINVAPSTLLVNVTGEEIVKHLEATVKELDCNLVSTKKITQGKTPGHEVKAEFKNNKKMSVKLRVFVVQDRLVQILARGQTKFVDGPLAKKVFDSFTLQP